MKEETGSGRMEFGGPPLWGVKEVPFSSAKLEALKLAVELWKHETGEYDIKEVIITAREFEGYLKEK